VNLRERWGALSARERVLITIAVVTALIVAARYVPFGRLTGLTSAGEDELWLQVQKVRNYQKILARRDAVRRQAEQLAARLREAEARLIPGETPTQVGAELQGRLSAMASEAGLNVLSSQILKEEEVDGFRRVGVRLTLSGKLEGIMRLLTSVETGSTDLAVTFLEINRKLGATRRPVLNRAVTTAVAASPLTATLEVKTFMRSRS